MNSDRRQCYPVALSLRLNEKGETEYKYPCLPASRQQWDQLHHDPVAVPFPHDGWHLQATSPNTLFIPWVVFVTGMRKVTNMCWSGINLCILWEGKRWIGLSIREGPGLCISPYSIRKHLKSQPPCAPRDLHALFPWDACGSHFCLDFNPINFLLSLQLSQVFIL